MKIICPVSKGRLETLGESNERRFQLLPSWLQRPEPSL